VLQHTTTFIACKAGSSSIQESREMLDIECVKRFTERNRRLRNQRIDCG
jgi:hypothetical protein